VSLESHILLLIEYSDGEPLREPVHAEPVGDGVFRLLHTPGFVLGVAAGDEVQLVGADGGFEVKRRGGNLAVQVFAGSLVAPLRPSLEAKVARLGGRLDGAIERGLAFTVPVSAGFAAVEAVFNDWVDDHPGWEWSFGNVYDPADGVTPLNWWVR
jgi:hypothetical protein